MDILNLKLCLRIMAMLNLMLTVVSYAIKQLFGFVSLHKTMFSFSKVLGHALRPVDTKKLE